MEASKHDVLRQLSTAIAALNRIVKLIEYGPENVNPPSIWKEYIEWEITTGMSITGMIPRELQVSEKVFVNITKGLTKDKVEYTKKGTTVAVYMGIVVRKVPWLKHGSNIVY